jgi:hypothetical protein
MNAGGKYEGETLDGKRHGRGVMKFWNGNTYHGEFVQDQFDGIGDYIWADGRTYKGQFKADKIHGRGTARWPDGKIYNGEWIADQADGHGILKLADHRVFEGTFTGNFPIHGQMIESNGTTFLSNFDGNSHASEWRPYRKSRVGVFLDGWNTDENNSYAIREFLWDDGRRFAGNCIGYCPAFGVTLESEKDLHSVVFDGRKTFAEGPFAVHKRRLNWPVRSHLTSKRRHASSAQFMPYPLRMQTSFRQATSRWDGAGRSCRKRISRAESITRPIGFRGPM